MKVRELIQQLQKLDPGLDVLCYEDGPVPIASSPGPFDLTDATVAHVERSRSSDGKPLMKFVAHGEGTAVAIIGITPDF